MDSPLSIWLGFDTREAVAFAVARFTARRRLNMPIPIYGLVLDQLIKDGLYLRPTERRDGRLWDVISDAPMSTEFAIARFLTPILAKRGWALFMDSDILVRSDLSRLFAEAEHSGKAVLCVQHNHVPREREKMDGQAQLSYPRKNWSSVMLFNCDHPANKRLTLDLINNAPGRDLHRLCWLDDSEIGALDPRWNWLVGASPGGTDPGVVHFTQGFPLMPGYENQPYAEDWREALAAWAAARTAR